MQGESSVDFSIVRMKEFLNESFRHFESIYVRIYVMLVAAVTFSVATGASTSSEVEANAWKQLTVIRLLWSTTEEAF
jgi:hypothetical protein